MVVFTFMFICIKASTKERNYAQIQNVLKILLKVINNSDKKFRSKNNKKRIKKYKDRKNVLYIQKKRKNKCLVQNAIK